MSAPEVVRTVSAEGVGKPERFDCTNGRVPYCMGCYTMTPDDDGAYVKFEAYSQLADEVERLTRDAARYRLLRDNSKGGSILLGDGSERGDWLNCDEPAAEWDSAIDYRIAEQQQTAGALG